MNFIEKLNDDNIEKLRHVKLRLPIEIEEYNSSKLKQVLNIIDDINISIVTTDFQGVLDKVNSLRDKNLYLISFKHFIITNRPANWTSDWLIFYVRIWYLQCISI